MLMETVQKVMETTLRMSNKALVPLHGAAEAGVGLFRFTSILWWRCLGRCEDGCNKAGGNGIILNAVNQSMATSSE